MGRGPAENPPRRQARERDLFSRILREKGRLGPFVTSRLKKQLRRALRLDRG